MQQSNQLPALIAQLRRDPALAERLPAEEGAMVRAALRGRSVYEIASEYETSEAAVWRVLSSAAREATGSELHPVETGGLGSDPGPGDAETHGPLRPAGSSTGTRLAADTEPSSDPPRPSQAEGEDEDEERPSDDSDVVEKGPRPSQAEGEDEDEERPSDDLGGQRERGRG